MRKRSDYILGTDRRRFELLGIGDIRNYPSEHLILQSWILIYPNEASHQCNTGVPLTHMGTLLRGREETGS